MYVKKSQLFQFKMISAHAVMTSDEARVEVKALREGAPFLGRHLPPVANGKVFKATHDLHLQKKS